MRLSEFQRKYLLRLSMSAIEESEVERWGKRPAAVMDTLLDMGFVESVDECWQITDAGLAAIGKQPA